jgi:phosphoglycolate phosphatase-like HAD superfamily hydrolase
MKPYALYIWDWNGTIQDDLNHIYECGVQRIFRHFNLPCPTLDTYRNQVTGDFMPSFYWPSGIPREVTGADLNVIMAEGFKEKGTPPNVFSDALATIQALRTSGARHLLVSAYDDTKIRGNVSKQGFDGLFEMIIGDATKKDQVFARVVAELGLPRHTVCTVGDMVADAEASKIADLDALLCPRGFHTRERIEAALPRLPQTKIIGTLSELVL